MTTVKLDGDQICELMENELTDLVRHFEEMLQDENPNMFVYGSPRQDKILIRAHLEAAKLLIDWYKA